MENNPGLLPARAEGIGGGYNPFMMITSDHRSRDLSAAGFRLRDVALNLFDVGADNGADEMAAAMAMYPMMKDAISRMRAESVKMDGTAIQTTTTIDAVKSEEQVAAEQQQQQQQQDSRSVSPSNPVGSVLGGLARRAANRNNSTPAGPRATFMTMTNEVLKVATTVSDADLAIPAGFKENK